MINFTFDFVGASQLHILYLAQPKMLTWYVLIEIDKEYNRKLIMLLSININFSLKINSYSCLR